MTLAELLDKLDAGRIGRPRTMRWLGGASHNELVEIVHANEGRRGGIGRRGWDGHAVDKSRADSVAAIFAGHRIQGNFMSRQAAEERYRQHRHMAFRQAESVLVDDQVAQPGEIRFTEIPVLGLLATTLAWANHPNRRVGWDWQRLVALSPKPSVPLRTGGCRWQRYMRVRAWEDVQNPHPLHSRVRRGVTGPRARSEGQDFADRYHGARAIL